MPGQQPGPVARGGRARAPARSRPSAARNPSSASTVEVLPAPLGPRSTVTCPASAAKESSSTAMTSRGGPRAGRPRRWARARRLPVGGQATGAARARALRSPDVIDVRRLRTDRGRGPGRAGPTRHRPGAARPRRHPRPPPARAGRRARRGPGPGQGPVEGGRPGPAQRRRRHRRRCCSESRGLGEREDLLDTEVAAVEGELRDLLLRIPNTPSESPRRRRRRATTRSLRVVGYDPDAYGDHQRVPHWETGAAARASSTSSGP